MRSGRTLALVLAGGKGARLHPLTAEHAKPALPFAGGYRIVDFVLSNLVNSGIRDIYVLAQYKPQSLVDHLRSAWDMKCSGRRIEIVLPSAATGSHGYQGTADAVFQNLYLVEEHAPDAVAVFAADHIYRMDVRQMLSFHERCDADVTVAAVTVPLACASSFGVMATEAGGRVTSFEEKPCHPVALPGDPTRAYVSMGNYLFKPQVLVGALLEGRRRGDTDFGHHVLPRLLGSRRIMAYNFHSNYVPGIQPDEEPGYWRDVGTIHAYLTARREVLGHAPRFRLYNPEWPLRGVGQDARAEASPSFPAVAEPSASVSGEQPELALSPVA